MLLFGIRDRGFNLKVALYICKVFFWNIGGLGVHQISER
jgi:hypothetical protein